MLTVVCNDTPTTTFLCTKINKKNVLSSFDKLGLGLNDKKKFGFADRFLRKNCFTRKLKH